MARQSRGALTARMVFAHRSGSSLSTRPTRGVRFIGPPFSMVRSDLAFYLEANGSSCIRYSESCLYTRCTYTAAESSSYCEDRRKSRPSDARGLQFSTRWSCQRRKCCYAPSLATVGTTGISFYQLLTAARSRSAYQIQVLDSYLLSAYLTHTSTSLCREDLTKQ